MAQQEEFEPTEPLDNFWHMQPSLPKCDASVIETKTRVGSYNILWDLGQGEFGKVRACQPRGEAGKGCPAGEYALKTIYKKGVTAKRDLRRAIRAVTRMGLEVEALTKLSPHPSICGLIAALHTPEYIHLVMERADYDLYDFFETGVPEVEAKHVIGRVASALAHCHDNLIAHRDIKPENVLIAGSPRLKCRVMLCDFGLCAKMTQKSWHLCDFVGSPGFFAPELLGGGTYDGRLIDVWSLGCLLLEMLLGHQMFHETWVKLYQDKDLGDGTKLRRRMMASITTLDPVLFQRTGRSEELRTLLLHGVLVPKVTQRFTMSQVLNSAWLATPKREALKSDASIARASPTSKEIELLNASPAQAARTLGVSVNGSESITLPSVPGAIKDETEASMIVPRRSFTSLTTPCEIKDASVRAHAPAPRAKRWLTFFLPLRRVKVPICLGRTRLRHQIPAGAPRSSLVERRPAARRSRRCTCQMFSRRWQDPQPTVSPPPRRRRRTR